MATLIIFTRIDSSTRVYFNNFFPGIDLDQEEFTFVEINPGPELHRIIFFNDEKEYDDIIINLTDLETNYIIYHISSHYIKNHQDYIRNLLPNCKEHLKIGSSRLGDHHNSDGMHYQYLVDASQTYSKNDLNSYHEIIDRLINNL
jgi:hypothetical protein